MKKIHQYLGLLLLVFSIPSFAATDDEIKHLLQFVEQTQCQYERNGKMHNGVAAVKHIKKKYQYFLDDIKTTEDFINYSATKSKMSGKYYQVHCNGRSAIKSQDWLLIELKKYRKNIDKNMAKSED